MNTTYERKNIEQVRDKFELKLKRRFNSEIPKANNKETLAVLMNLAQDAQNNGEHLPNITNKIWGQFIVELNYNWVEHYEQDLLDKFISESELRFKELMETRMRDVLTRNV